MMDKGAALNRRVWQLFEKAGFRTEPNAANPAEHVVELAKGKKRPVDLYASVPDLGVTLIGSNKSGGWSDSWSAHVNDFQEIKKAASAGTGLFVVTGRELSVADQEYVRAKGMFVWGEDELAYYQAVADAIKGYAKYEIIKALGLSTTEEKDTHRVLALRLRQPTSSSRTELFLFTLAPERLLKTCVIYRRAQGNAAAYQRMLRPKRLPRIRNFVSQPSAILPTNLVVHLSETVTVDPIRLEDLRDAIARPITLSHPGRYDLVALNIPMKYASIELIDGQHRLFGFAEAASATRTEFNLVVLGIKDLDLKQQRDTFVAINDNARRMDPNLVSYLKYTTDDEACQRESELMAIRVVVELNKTTPFKKAVRLLDVEEQRVTLKGFSGYDLRGLLAPRGLLRKHYPANRPDEYVNALRTYFSTVRSLFKKEWDDPKKYIIGTNRGISALLKLLRSILPTFRTSRS